MFLLLLLLFSVNSGLNKKWYNFKLNAGLVEQPKRDIYLAINSVKQANLSAEDIESKVTILLHFSNNAYFLCCRNHQLVL